MWSIIAARVVVLPEPVVPVTSTRPRGSRARRLMISGRCSSSKRGDLGGDLAHGDADAAALAEHVDAEAAEVGRRVGEVDLVVLAEAADLLVGHDRRRDVLGVFGRERRLVHERQLAVDAHDRRAPRLDVQVRRVARHHLAEQLIDGFHVAAPVARVLSPSPTFGRTRAKAYLRSARRCRAAEPASRARCRAGPRRSAERLETAADPGVAARPGAVAHHVAGVRGLDHVLPPAKMATWWLKLALPKKTRSPGRRSLSGTGDARRAAGRWRRATCSMPICA